MFPGNKAPCPNVYSDIAAFFCLVNQSLTVTGTYLFEERKQEYFRRANDIINYTNELSAFYYVPMPSERANQWERPLNDLESEKIRDIVYYISVCRSAYWNQFRNIDKRLVQMINDFQTLLMNQIPDYSMEKYLQIFKTAFPNELSSKENSDMVSVYLLLAELEYELSHTSFYRVYPSLYNISTGITLRTISNTLYANLSFLQSRPGFASVVSQLSFGHSHLINMSRGCSVDVIDRYLNDVICVLYQIRTIANTTSKNYINQFVNSIMSFQMRVKETPYLRQELALIREYYVLSTELCCMQRVDQNRARVCLKRIGEILGYFDKNLIYRELAKEMANMSAQLLRLYGFA